MKAWKAAAKKWWWTAITIDARNDILDDRECCLLAKIDRLEVEVDTLLRELGCPPRYHDLEDE